MKQTKFSIIKERALITGKSALGDRQISPTRKLVDLKDKQILAQHYLHLLSNSNRVEQSTSRVIQLKTNWSKI